MSLIRCGGMGVHTERQLRGTHVFLVKRGVQLIVGGDGGVISR